MNWTRLRLSISDWSIIMIGPGGLLLVVPSDMQFQVQFYWWGCQKNTAKQGHIEHPWRCSYVLTCVSLVVVTTNKQAFIGRAPLLLWVPLEGRMFCWASGVLLLVRSCCGGDYSRRSPHGILQSKVCYSFVTHQGRHSSVDVTPLDLRSH